MSVQGSAPPDPRALLAVLEAARRSGTGSQTTLTEASLAAARGQGVGDLQVRRAVDAYADAVQGFIRPQASAGYVFAALYALRRRVGKWIGIPFLVLVAISAGAWGYNAGMESARLERWETAALRQLKQCHGDYEEAAADLRELDDRIRTARPAPTNLKTLQFSLSVLHALLDDLQKQLDRDRRRPELDRERRVRILRQQANSMAGVLEEFKKTLIELSGDFRTGLELAAERQRLDHLLSVADSLAAGAPGPKAIHGRGVQAVERGDLEAVSESISELSAWIAQEREAASISARLDEHLAHIRDLTADPEIRKNAATIHEQGRNAFGRSDRHQAKEASLLLADMAARLSEEYTIIITGGKWRHRNDNPSIRTYYVIVRAVAPSGAKLSRYVKNEEDGSAETVREWGERVPFELYERVRKDKLDNGRIDQDVFGRKERGRLEDEVTIRTDDGELVRRAGQITRW